MMNDQEISFDKLSSKVNALLIIDIQEKIIRPIFYKDLIIKNIKKIINAYQILEENIFVSEQNPLKLGVTIPELTPIAAVSYTHLRAHETSYDLGCRLLLG